jgi:hypothetical protein
VLALIILAQQYEDLVKLDVTVEVGGFMADACETAGVGSITQKAKRLINCAVGSRVSFGLFCGTPWCASF